ncbi:MAG: bifunctional phosphoglucose/phosphomannose isomerase [Chloroflexi bacterium RBG_16_50_11]|nr:MAG: bifunctional phosphoglucose/phosphomannose isomerase [Chloroflexi bacterium RBG_16_50_11]
MVAANLDDIKLYPSIDPEGMLARIKELPMQCQQAWQSAMSLALPANYRNVDKVVVLGMGGSAIGGDLVRTLVQEEAKIPVLIHRDYGLPAFVDDKTLLIASSYSGNTEETLSGFELALKTGAKKLVMTSGGKLGKMAEAHHIPLFKIEYKAQPRAALGFSFIPTLGIMQKLGFISDKSADVKEAIQVLEKLSARLDEKSPQKSNPAKQLAQRLYGCLPVIYGAGIAAEAAHRWKTQLNENSKSWAFYEVFPELNHNATVGFPLPKEIASKIRVVLLRSPTFNARIKLRYDVTCELLKQSGVAYEFVDGEGQSALSQMVSLVSFGDYVSYYLAILYKVDPSPVKVISYLKERLEKG